MKRTITTLIAGLTTTALLAACGGEGTSTVGAPSSSTSTTQPTALVTAPERDRVDLDVPVFSNPTSITNPRFPISDLAQVIQLGDEATAKVRTEVTLLPETRTIDWNGTPIEALVSQFTAFKDGRVVEVAVDFFAQADDGSVWYFGEDVFNYENGLLADTEGTWLAGKDGPPGMIMPADPKVGDVYRPENAPGFVFEEVTVKKVDQTVDGPRGPVPGAVIVQEALMDGQLENKTFAPGYGEFFFAVEAEEEVVHMALAVPTDALGGPVPEQLTSLLADANDLFDAAASEDWTAIGASIQAMTAARDSYRADQPPALLAAQLDDALDVLVAGAERRDAADVRQGAINVAYGALDLALQHRSPAEVDHDRMERWARQVQVDVEVDDAGAVAGDVVVLTAIWERVAHTVDATSADRIERELRNLRDAGDAANLTAAAKAAVALQDVVAGIS